MKTIQELPRAKVAATGGPLLRVLVVDDHPLFRAGLKELLEHEPDLEICGEAENEEQAFQRFTETNADLVTVDISLASGHGLNLVKRIKRARPTTIVLVVSMFDDRVYAERALDAGASGYVCKQSANNELIVALRSVRNGDVYVNESIFKQILQRKVSGRKPVGGAKYSDLSGRELQIFTLIGQGRTTHEISKELHLAVSTVETYRERLKTKLALSSGAELTRHAILWVMQNA